MRTRSWASVRWSVVALAVSVSQVQAGMPSVRLTDLASLRVSTISFFLVCFLLCAGCLAVLWNRVLREVVDLPRISFRRAAALLLVWGMLFNVVLTMISGARELLTPGAWEPRGVIHQLKRAADGHNGENANEIRMRCTRLERLGLELWKAARENGGRYPDLLDVGTSDAELRKVPGVSGLRYNYQSGCRTDGDIRVLAYEPDGSAVGQFALLTDGSVVELTSSAREQYGLEE